MVAGVLEPRGARGSPVTCSGIHTHYALKSPVSFTCDRCDGVFQASVGPLPKVCADCANDELRVCMLCGELLEEDGPWQE